jgi:hypothetical protein
MSTPLRGNENDLLGLGFTIISEMLESHLNEVLGLELGV